MMRERDPERELARLHEAAARISANLVELEIEPVRQTLEATSLQGDSAARWARASAAVTELWQRQGLLEALLEQADGLRGLRRAGALRALLESDSIELGGFERPLAERDLLGSATTTARCSPQELLDAMAASFDEVKLVVAGFGAAWERLVPRLDVTRRQLAEARELAEALGAGARPAADELGRQLETLSRAITTDPLSVAEPDVERVERSVRALRDELHATLELKRSFEARFLEARTMLERVRTAARDVHTARAELERQIVVSTDTAPEALDDGGLADQLSHLASLSEAGEWRETRTVLEQWMARAAAHLAEAERALAACRAPLDARKQLRALLDAYRVKAKRVGRLEDPRVADLYTRAHTCLYTAPTDLALSAQLVHSYQQAVSDPIEVSS